MIKFTVYVNQQRVAPAFPRSIPGLGSTKIFDTKVTKFEVVTRSLQKALDRVLGSEEFKELENAVISDIEAEVVTISLES